MPPQHHRTRRRQHTSGHRRRPPPLGPLPRERRRQLCLPAPLARRQPRLGPAGRRVRRAPQTHVQVIVVPRPRPHLPQPAPVSPLPLAQIALDGRPDEDARDPLVDGRQVDQLRLSLAPPAPIGPPGGGLDHRRLGDPLTGGGRAGGDVQPEPDVHVQPALMADVPRGHGPPARLRQITDQHGAEPGSGDVAAQRGDEGEEVGVAEGAIPGEVGDLVPHPFGRQRHRPCDAGRAIAADHPRRPRSGSSQRAPGGRNSARRRGESDREHAQSGDQGSTERSEHREGQRV
jgi:hypothetical protein